MTRSKMAVRKKTKSNFKQLNFDFVTANKMKSFLRVSGLLLLLATVGFFGKFVVDQWSTVWPVKKITLEGEPVFVTQENIEQLLLSLPKQGMFAIDLQQLYQHTMQLDWIKNLEVRKKWPDELVFIVEEHQPVARFSELLLTHSGKLIHHAETIESADPFYPALPVVEYAEWKELPQDKAVKIWSQFKQIKRQFELLGLDAVNMTVDASNSWKLEFSNHLVINLGRKERLERAKRLIDVFDQIENVAQLKQIDLRYHNGMAVAWNKNNWNKDNPIEQIQEQQKG